jgi:dynein intermediate chain
MSMQREDDSLGLVCVWSKDLHARPEKVFTAPSPVLTALFYSSDTVADQQQLVIGGCYSGQILLWDMMEKSTPKQRSSMSGQGRVG